IASASFSFEPRKGLVLLHCGNTVASLRTLLALLARGHAVILIGAESTAGSRALEERYRPDVVAAPDRDEWRESASKGAELHPDLGVMLSPSGSTGSPKLARFANDALLANGESIAAYLGIGPSDVAFAHLPLHYSYGLSILTSHLARGGSLALTS